MDNIIKVKFSEGQETQFDNSLKQWNFGQTLQVEGVAIPDGEVEVHYSLTENCGNASVFVGTVKNNVITVKIPNFLLTKENVYQSTYEAYAWIYLTDEESGQTIRKIVFTIESRAKPDDYVYTEEEKREYDKLKAEVEGLSQSQDELKKEVEDISTDQKSLQKDVEGNTTKIDNLKEEVDELPIEKGTGKNSFKIGDIINNVASAERAIAGGNNTKATRNNSVALNNNTHTDGADSMAINTSTVTKAKRTFAAGFKTIASSIHQFVFGTYNIEDANEKYVHIIGNGTSESNRSNAHTLDWEGNGWYAGDVYVGSENKKLATFSDASSGELLIEWDGNKGSRYSVNFGNAMFVKVSDETPLLSDAKTGDFYKCYRSIGISTHSYGNSSFITKQFDGAWGIYMNDSDTHPEVIVITGENATVNDLTFAEKGIYFLCIWFDGAIYVNEFYLSNATKLARIDDTLMSDVVKTVLSNSAYMSEAEKKAIRDALGITELIESLQTQSETE